MNTINQTTTKKTKSGWRKIAAAALCLTMGIGCIAGGALAKYTTTVSGNDTASVAMWKFEVNDANVTTSGNAAMTFDLFNTIKDSNGTDAETDVKAGMIAPGTSGSFDVKVENLSEVNATYDLDFSVENASNIPIKFSTDGRTWKDSDSINELDVSGKAIAMESGTDTVTVQWKWDFTGDNAADTALGIAAQQGDPNVKVTCAATFTQVD